MSTRRITSNSKGAYLIALVVIIVAFLLLGGVPWIKGMLHESMSIGMVNWNWAQILISLGIGFLLGLLISRK